MVTTPLKVEKRLTIQVENIAENTTTIRSLDWDRDRFDIEFGLQNGTTYNSYIIRGEKLALVDTSHEKFRQLYLDILTGLINPQDLDYLIISHTEPDHSGLVKDVLKLAPHVTVVGSKVALKFLEDFVHDPFKQQIVKTGDQIDLGNGHIMEFVNAPNLHWPDTMLSYDRKTEILYTCDVFGMHYCSNQVWDENLSVIEPDYRFYYDCLMGPNARSVLAALKRMETLGNITQVANGHGPILKYNVTELISRYDRWSQAQTKAEQLVSVFYIADYGYSDRLSQAIARGVMKTGVGLEMVDLRSIDPQEVQEIISRSSAIILGMPPISGQNNKEIINNMGTILAAAKDKQLIGFFESYGGNDEPIDPLLTKFREVGLASAFPPIRIKNTPSETVYQICEESGTDLGQKLTQTQKVQKENPLIVI
jgi:flavorubredoxin